MNLIVDIQVFDLRRAVHFYTEVLGFMCRKQEKEWAALLIGDAEIHLYVDGGVTGGVEFSVSDIDTEVKKLTEKSVVFISGMHKRGALSVDENNITDFPYGRLAYFLDSEGNELALVKDFA